MRYRARLVICPKQGIADPEGDILRERLNRKGLKISKVRSGKYWQIEFDAESKEDALSFLEKTYLHPPMTNPIKDEPQLLTIEEIQ